MSEFVDKLIVPVISSSAILGIFVFFIKRYLDRYIVAHFNRLERDRQIDYNLKTRTSEFVLDNQLGMYAEVVEIIYRLRNEIKQNLKKDNAYEWNPDFHLMVGHLTENMFRYRIFLSNEIFENLHQFKQIAQDGLVLYDTYTRPENVSDNSEYLKQRDRYSVKAEHIDALYNTIVSYVQDKMSVQSGDHAR